MDDFKWIIDCPYIARPGLEDCGDDSCVSCIFHHVNRTDDIDMCWDIYFYWFDILDDVRRKRK